MRSARILAWTLGLGGAAACTVTIAWTVALGLYSVHVLLYPAFIMAGILGALVASREPRNSVGWLMCIASLAAILFYLPIDYGYTALIVHSGSWPFGRVALWFGASTWAPLLGLFLPLLTVRFPDGKVPHGWRVVDWLVAAGTAVFALGIAVAPPSMLGGFLLATAANANLVALAVANPLATPVATAHADLVIAAGLAVMLLAYVLAVASAIGRFRGARSAERLQLKWFAYAGVVIAVAQIYGGLALIGTWESPNDVQVAVHLSTLGLPVAIGIAILHYRLYDIDLLINRTLVYGGLTAILAAAYTAGITLLQRLFVAVSGQKSDVAYVLTAFGIVVGFTPVKGWLQGQVDRHFAHQSPTVALGRFRTEVETVVSVMDVDRVARRLLDEAVMAFDARGAALHLGASNGPGPLYSRGSINGTGRVEVPLQYGGQGVGRLLLGSRRGGVEYTKHDRKLLQQSADSVAEAVALAEHLGLRPVVKRRSTQESSNDTATRDDAGAQQGR